MNCSVSIKLQISRNQSEFTYLVLRINRDLISILAKSPKNRTYVTLTFKFHLQFGFNVMAGDMHL